MSFSRSKSSDMRSGFSLIELIVSIAIMALLVGIISLSVGLLRTTDTKGLASHINDSLTDLKAVTQSHAGPYYLHIYKDENGYYATYDSNSSFTSPEDDATVTRLGAPSLTVQTDTGVLGESGYDVITVSVLKKDGSYDMAPKYFNVLSGDRLDYKVILAKDTGVHYLEQQ